MSDSGSVGPVDGSDGNVLRAALSTENPSGREEDPPALADYDPLPEEQPDEAIELDPRGQGS